MLVHNYMGSPSEREESAVAYRVHKVTEYVGRIQAAEGRVVVEHKREAEGTEAVRMLSTQLEEVQVRLEMAFRVPWFAYSCRNGSSLEAH